MERQSRALIRRVVLVVGLAMMVPAVARAAPPAQGELDVHRHLPAAWRGIAPGDLVPPPTVVNTPVPVATVTPRATSTATPTLTETPAPTPTVAASIVGRLTIGGEAPPSRLGLAPGPALWLRKFVEGVWTNVARAGTDRAGDYAFDGVLPLGEGEKYQVFWQNEMQIDPMGTEKYIGSWFTPQIVDFDGTADVTGVDIELEDIVLTHPTHGTGFIGHIPEFRWNARANADDRYQWGICDCCERLEQRLDAWLSPSLGSQTKYQPRTYPPGIIVGKENFYCWFIRANAQGGAYGESFYIRMLWFELFGAAGPDGMTALPSWLGRE